MEEQFARLQGCYGCCQFTLLRNDANYYEVLNEKVPVSGMIIMMQKEVADRITASQERKHMVHCRLLFNTTWMQKWR